MWILTPQSASAPGPAHAVGRFLRSVYVSLQTPCKYLQNSAKCPEYAGISRRAPGVGQAACAGPEPLPPATPAPVPAPPDPSIPRDVGVRSYPPVGGQKERGMRQGQRQRSCRNCASVAGRSAGSAASAAPRPGLGPWGRRGRRGHIAPKETAFLAPVCLASSVPVPGQSRCQPGAGALPPSPSGDAGRGGRPGSPIAAAAGPGRCGSSQRRAPAPALPAVLQCSARPGWAVPLRVSLGLSAQM